MKYISPCLLFFGALTLGASVFVGYYLVPYKVWENIMEQSRIVRGNTRFNSWEEIPIPLFQRIFFFNVTNPDEVIQGGKPILHGTLTVCLSHIIYFLAVMVKMCVVSLSLPPIFCVVVGICMIIYVRQKRRKVDIEFSQENGTVFYREKTTYFFRPDLSTGSESDPINFINIPLVSVAKKMTQMDMLTSYVIRQMFLQYPKEKLYFNTTIGQLMFGGMYLPFMQDLAELNGKEILPNNTFGLYYGKNGSDQGHFEIFTGVDDPDKFGNVASWNGMSSLDWWEYEYCNKINGSDGGIFQPFSTKETIFYMFIPGLFKSFRFEFDEGGMNVKRIPVNKYSISPSFFESAKTNPDNACYCAQSKDNLAKCPESGVFPLEKCGKGAMVLSQPHFYQGADLYLNQSVGLQPDKERHEMALYIESYTSVTAKVKIRFQMNVDLQPSKYIRSLKKVPRMVHPLFWIDQNVEIPDDSASIIRDKLYGTVYIANLLTHIGMILGLIFIILSLLTFFLCASRKPGEAGGKIECVSYQPQGMLQNGKLAFSTTNYGKITNGFVNNSNHNRKMSESHHTESNEDAATPLIKQNGHTKPSSGRANGTPVTDTGGGGQELIVTFCTDDDDNDSQSLFQDSHVAVDCSQNHTQFSGESTTMPDSRLSPFPVVTTDSSSSLIVAGENSVNNTLRDLVEATSSYGNL